MPKPTRQVLVCTNTRPPGNPKGSCGEKGSETLFDALKARLRQEGLDRSIMVNRASCLKHCSRGATVAVQPDNAWYGGVTEADLAEIVDGHLKGGRVVQRLVMPDIPWE